MNTVSVSTNPQIKENLPSSGKLLIGSQLVFDDSINIDPDTPNIQSDPISLSILNSIKRDYSKEIGENIILSDLYKEFIKASTNYINASDYYNQSIGIVDITSNVSSINKSSSVFNIKREYDSITNKLYNQLNQLNVNTNISASNIYDTNTEYRTNINSLINNLFLLIEKYLNACKLTFIALHNKFEKKKKYMESFISFYKKLYTNQSEILNKMLKDSNINLSDKFKMEIKTELLYFDYICYKNILDYKNYKENFDEVKLNKLILEFDKSISYFSIKKYNMKEIFIKFYEHRELVMIEKYQYDIYILVHKEI